MAAYTSTLVGFVFPLLADAAVCHFSAKIREQEIVAEVQERETARDRYDDAVSSGQQAFLLEESAESPDVFRLSVGTGVCRRVRTLPSPSSTSPSSMCRPTTRCASVCWLCSTPDTHQQ
ncbi:protein mono-ADP-ribosyltransferase PARP4-like isoform X2 [Pimephales promelas]|nr:protein mono-ADP-ribosyltransferase PARP4-like isoform X2 [Pimephales promelas]